MKLVAALIGLAIPLAFAPLGSEADAEHSALVCGRLIEYRPAPSTDIRHGYAHVRLTTATGDTSVLFHDTNPTNTPSRIDPAATRQPANICITGPYVHVVGSSPYVSPYDLRLAPAGMPNTSTAPALGSGDLALVAVAVAVVLAGARRNRARRSRDYGRR